MRHQHRLHAVSANLLTLYRTPPHAFGSRTDLMNFIPNALSGKCLVICGVMRQKILANHGF
ncbi:MAG TPA: hypothetical protein DEF59_03795 [Candidatus Magasanikbacteria bacterium]|nr:hypothetical protein [Candidatus Magasanikbacteria bacterium]